MQELLLLDISLDLALVVELILNSLVEVVKVLISYIENAVDCEGIARYAEEIGVAGLVVALSVVVLVRVSDSKRSSSKPFRPS